MSVQRKVWLPLVLIALVALPLLVSGCSAQSLAAPLGAPAAVPSGERALSVLGRGMVSVKPDLAVASVGVETFAGSVAEAVQQNNTKMADVMAKLKELGIADKDIQTANYSINSERPGGEMAPSQYRVSNMVQVKIRDMAKVSTVLDAAVQAGANQVWGVNFTIEDTKAYEAEARTKAMADARERGEALAKLANVQLGRVIYVGEGGTINPMPAFRGMGGGAALQASDSAVTISPGEVQFTYDVQVTFAIE
ncbi:MAG: SIMPL domain-containing protein [Anaerolineae bacterium]